MVLASPSMARNAGSTTSLPVCNGELAPLLTIQEIDVTEYSAVTINSTAADIWRKFIFVVISLSRNLSSMITEALIAEIVASVRSDPA